MIADRQTPTQTDRQTDTLITKLRSLIGGGVKNRNCASTQCFMGSNDKAGSNNTEANDGLGGACTR